MNPMAYGGMYITGGADTQAMTTTAGAMVSWSEAGGANAVSDSNARDGDPAIIPDKANNRIKLNTPGVYLVSFDLAGLATTGCNVAAQLRKNGVVVTGAKGLGIFSTTNGAVSFQSIVEVTRSDSPGTLPTFADPASTGFAGAGGAPKTECALDVVLSILTSTDTLTLVEAHLNVIRLR